MDIINGYIIPHQIRLRTDLVEQKIIDSFHARVNIDFKTGCWNWTGGHKCWKNQTLDYGIFGAFSMKVPNKESDRPLAHRVSWVIHYGLIPDGYDLCHKCDNPRCVNPEHLFLGTRSDNMQDMTRKGRQRGPRGGKVHTAQLTESQVIEIKRMLLDKIPKIDIAARFGVKWHTIHRIYKGETWRWVND